MVLWFNIMRKFWDFDRLQIAWCRKWITTSYGSEKKTISSSNRFATKTSEENCTKRSINNEDNQALCKKIQLLARSDGEKIIPKW